MDKLDRMNKLNRNNNDFPPPFFKYWFVFVGSLTVFIILAIIIGVVVFGPEVIDILNKLVDKL